MSFSRKLRRKQMLLRKKLEKRKKRMKQGKIEYSTQQRKTWSSEGE